MLDCGWAPKIDSIDNSQFEGAIIIYDLNQPINESLTGTYDLIISFFENLYSSLVPKRSEASFSSIMKGIFA